MITLDLEDYCDDCPAFDPSVDRATWYSPDDEITHRCTIKCKHSSLCKGLVRRLIKKLKEAEKEEADGSH